MTLRKKWRLILSPPAAGDWNMALDQALFETFQETANPILRFYTWSPATLSLGRFQNPHLGLDTQTLNQIAVVRRITGGGAIWHDRELTYSLCCHQDDVGAAGVKASFEKLSGFILGTWSKLGLNANFAKDAVVGESFGAAVPACFASKEEYDIVVNGKKLGGNAQRRQKEFIFQHGSIPFDLDWPFLSRLFKEGFRPAQENVTSLAECGISLTANELAALLAQEFERKLLITLEISQPSASERELATTLQKERFGDRAWTSGETAPIRSGN